MKKMSLLLVALFFCAACQEESKPSDSEGQAATDSLAKPTLLVKFSPSNDSLYTEALRLHDEVMPKIDNILRLQRDFALFKEKRAPEGLVLDSLKAYNRSLLKGEEAMMDWMRLFKAREDYAGWGPDSLERELVMLRDSIKVVSELMLRSIEQSSYFLEQQK